MGEKPGGSMISQRTDGLHSLLIVAQIATALLLYTLLVVGFSQARGHLDLSRYVLYAGVVMGALAVESLSRDKLLVRTCIFEQSLIKLHSLAFRQIFAVTVALVLFVALLKDATLSRIFLVTFVGLLYPALLLTNRQLPRWLARTVFRGIREQKTLLVGPSAKIPKLQAWLRRKAEFGFQPVGLLCDEECGESIHELPVLGGSDEIERVLREQQIAQVIVLGLPQVLHAYSHLITVCNRRGVRLMILSDLEERLHHPAIHIEDDGLQFITLRQEPLENPLKRLLKRGLDMAVALTVVIFLLPFTTVLVWLLQSLQSPGPLFYRQTRAGIQNREFQIIKYRTMHTGDFDENRQATADDERIFPAGVWLRKLSVDELPQFLNVLRAEMSVVGPRPHLLEHNRQFALLLANYQIRAFVRPGVTGLAQVRGLRGEATTPEAIAARLEADTQYLENWSLFLDLGIIVRTAWQMAVPPRTAV